MSSYRVTGDGQIAIDRCGPLILSAFARGGISDESWRQYCAFAVELIGKEPCAVALNFAPVSGPSARQRQIFVEEFGPALRIDAIARTVICSESMLVRGTLTATAWLASRFNRAKVRAFKPEEVTDALAWLHEAAPFPSTVATRRLSHLLQQTGWSEQYALSRRA